MGVKIYLSKAGRDKSYKNQVKLNKNGIAPETYGTIDFTIPNVTRDENWWKYAIQVSKNKVYGYYTQIAKQCRPHFVPSLTFSKRVRELGYKGHDLKGDNLGYIGNKLVVIDTDNNSLS
jgi:hypothetical protein